MRRVLVLLACLVGLPAGPTPAAADGFYFTEAFGGGDVKSDLGDYMSSAFRFRIAGGMRQGPWAVELHFGAMIDVGPPGDDNHYAPFRGLTVGGIDLKYIQPLGGPFEVYLRGGLSYATIDDETDKLANYQGRGAGAGAGIQLKGRVRALGFLAWPLFFTKIGPKVTGALWVDAGYDFYRLHRNDSRSIDAAITSITGGFAIGSDF